LHDVNNSKNRTYIATLLLLLIASTVVASPLLYSKIAHAADTFPPGVFYNSLAIPSYAITIPFSSFGKSYFDPTDVLIPLGMTVIWFNDSPALNSSSFCNYSIRQHIFYTSSNQSYHSCKRWIFYPHIF
jgi:hypothetical protein